jgi:RNA polymerase sigma factor (sigma-70 family)
MDDTEFAAFLAALRRGDAQAGETLDRVYSPILRRVIRPWLASNQLRPASDTADLCQAVLWKIIVCLREGRYPDVQTHAHLRNLLCRMARNAFYDLHRKEQRGKRGDGAPGPTLPGPEETNLADSASSPSQHVAREELIAQFRQRLSEQARQVHDWREAGWGWAQIGAALGQPANTVRIRFNRECQRAARALGLDGEE